MPFRATTSTVVSVMQARHARPRRRPAFEFSALDVLRPCVLGCAALAIAVLLWGYGYKLSLYHQHERHSQVPVAKLWIEHRSSAFSSASKLRIRANSLTVSLPFAHLAPHNLCELEQPLDRPSFKVARLATAGSLIPLRSPPSIPLLQT